MKFISLEGDIFEGKSPSEILQQLVSVVRWGIDGTHSDPIEELKLRLKTHLGISITTRDKTEILEQLQDQGYLLRIS